MSQSDVQKAQAAVDSSTKRVEDLNATGEPADSAVSVGANARLIADKAALNTAQTT